LAKAGHGSEYDAHHGVKLVVRRVEDHDLGPERRHAAHDVVDEIELHAASRTSVR